MSTAGDEKTLEPLADGKYKIDEEQKVTAASTQELKLESRDTDTNPPSEPVESNGMQPSVTKPEKTDCETSKPEPYHSTEKETLPAKTKLKIYLRKQFWIDLLLSLAVATAYYAYETWPRPLLYIQELRAGLSPSPIKIIPNLNMNYPIPSSPHDLTNLAEQERFVYYALQKCQERAMNPTGGPNNYTGFYLAAVNRYLVDYETSSQKLFKTNFSRAPELIAGNPIASFRMINRFVSILKLLHVDHYRCEEFHNSTYQLAHVIRWPDARDLEDNILRILRLQHVYHLEAEQVRQGMLVNIPTKITLSAWQSYQLGLIALKHQMYYLSIQWLELALQSSGGGGENTETSFYNQVLTALNRAVAQHDSSWNNDLVITTTEFHFSKKLDMKTKTEVANTDFNKFVPNRVHWDPRKQSNLLVEYWATCSGEDLRPQREISKLYCWLESKNHPTWTIRPLKMEFLSLDPDIVQVYDILSDRIIKEVISTTNSTMKSSLVIDTDVPHKSVSRPFTGRTSRQAWVSDWSHPTLNYFSLAVERITGVLAHTEASEDLQVLAYSFGGHYTPHSDDISMFVMDARSEHMGDRMLTFMFYLSDVQAGGYTAFTSVGMAAKPVKGSGVFWFNLFKDGHSNYPAGQHGGCPVILGHKFAANKWIRLYEQFKDWKCAAKGQKLFHRAKVNGIFRET